MTFHKLLIANRGEIACRVIKSAHEMGISCVAVYTNADSESPFVRQADEAVKLSDTYLNGKEIIIITATIAIKIFPLTTGLFVKSNVDLDISTFLFSTKGNKFLFSQHSQYRIYKNINRMTITESGL